MTVSSHMCLLNIALQIQSYFAVILTSSLLGKLFSRCLSTGVGICGHSATRVLPSSGIMLIIWRPRAQSAFQFIPVVLGLVSGRWSSFSPTMRSHVFTELTLCMQGLLLRNMLGPLSSSEENLIIQRLSTFQKGLYTVYIYMRWLCVHMFLAIQKTGVHASSRIPYRMVVNLIHPLSV